MSEGFNSHVVLCWPSNKDEIKFLSALSDDVPFAPTIEHSLSTCDSCERSVWIAEQQLQMVRSPLIRSKKLCFFCVNEINQVLALRPQEVDISPGLRDAVRRTA